MATGEEVLERLAELVAQKSGGSFGAAMRDQQLAAKKKQEDDKRSKANKKATEEMDDLAEAADGAGNSINDNTGEVEKNTNRLINFGSAVKNIARDFVRLGEQEARFAMQAATADAGWIEGVTNMGISQLEYMKLLKTTRVENLAMASAGVDFKNSLFASQKSLIGLTASTAEAARVSGMFHKNMARVGVSQQNLGDAVLQQTKIYEQNYRALGYSAEEFANLTAELINDQGMRDILLTLQEKERKAYVLGIQQRMAEYQTMGYTIERAKELQKTFQALHGMDPKERMKQAAKKRAMMGAMGMGGEAAELFDLEIRYRTMTAEQKKDADIRMAQIQADAAKAYGEMSGAGSSLGQSMVMQAMAAKTGFDKVAQTFETETGQGMKIDEKQLAATNEIPDVIKGAITVMDHWGAAQHSALFSVGTNIVKELGGVIMTAATISAGTSLLGKMGGMGKMLTGAGGMLGTLGIGAAGVGAAGAAGYGIGTLLNDILMPDDGEQQRGLGEEIGKWLADFVHSTDNTELDEKIKRQAEIKQKRLQLKAEGFVETPRGMRKKSDAKAAETAPSATMTTPTQTGIDKSKQKQEEHNKELLSTLKDLKTYLKSMSDQTSAQAMAVAKTADAITKNIEYNKLAAVNRVQ